MGRPRIRSDSKKLPPRMHKKMHKKGSTYYYVTSTGGQRKWTSLGKDYAKALKKWAQMEAASLPSSGEMESAIRRYLRDIVPEKAESTQRNYERACKRLIVVFGSLNIDDIKPVHIYQYLDKHPHKTTANREIAVLSAVFTKAIRWGLTERNPCRGVERNKETPRDRYITDDELAQLKAVATPFIRAVIDLAYITALRKGDILKIRLSDITEEGLIITQQKTGAKQCYTWTPALRQAIDNAKALPRRTVISMHLFSTRSGKPYTTSGFDSVWQRIVKKSGLKNLHFHDIRAKSLTDASRLHGKDHAQAMAGHASVTMTERYIKSRDHQTVQPLR